RFSRRDPAALVPRAVTVREDANPALPQGGVIGHSAWRHSNTSSSVTSGNGASVCHAGLRSPQSGTIGPLYFDARVVKACHRAEDRRDEVEVDLARVVRDRMTAGCDPLDSRGLTRHSILMHTSAARGKGRA